MMLWSDRSEKRIQEAATEAATKARAEGIAEGIKEGKAELAEKVREWNMRRLAAEENGNPFYEPPPTE